MEYTKIQDTDITVSKIALGTWVFAGDYTWGLQDDGDSVRTVHAALDAGINLLDTADGYGEGKSEMILGKALKGRRSDAVIATKANSGEPVKDNIVKACEESLKRLGTDYIDIYQLHWPRRNVPFEDTMEGLRQLLDEGRIRAVGVSNFGVKDMDEITKWGPVHANQLAYNILFRAVEYEIQPACIQKGIGILCYSPLAQGLCNGKYVKADEVPEGRRRARYLSDEEPETADEVFNTIARIRSISDKLGQPMGRVALSWLLHREGVASVLAGARSSEQVQENVKAAELKLTGDILEELDKGSGKLKEIVGANADMWRKESRIK